MIERRAGNILGARAEWVVIPVNTVGVMGKGLALAAAQRWPEMLGAYRRWCFDRDVRARGGSVGLWRGAGREPPHPVWFATKEHWRNPSRIEWIDRGLTNLRQMLLNERCESVAVPLLGCGLGGLDEHEVVALIERHLGDLPATVELWRPA